MVPTLVMANRTARPIVPDGSRLTPADGRDRRRGHPAIMGGGQVIRLHVLVGHVVRWVGTFGHEDRAPRWFEVGITDFELNYRRMGVRHLYVAGKDRDTTELPRLFFRLVHLLVAWLGASDLMHFRASPDLAHDRPGTHRTRGFRLHGAGIFEDAGRALRTHRPRGFGS